MKKLRENVRKVLRPGNQDDLELVVKQLNRRLVGWHNYFKYGTLGTARHDLDRYIEARVRGFLRRRHKILSLGTRQFSFEHIFDELGVLKSTKRPRLRAAHARV